MGYLIYVKRIIGLLWKWMPAGGDARRVVLLYHAVDSGPASTRLKEFREQLQWLSRNAEVLSLDALLAGEGTGAVRVAITFDDGYESVFSKAAPLLLEMGMPATVYVNAGLIGEGSERRSSDPSLGHYPGENFMKWDELNALLAQGWIIGSHGVNHVDLTGMPASQVMEELATSKRLIEERLDVACSHFAYTWGRYTKAVRDAVASSRYASAMSAIHGGVSALDDVYALPRIDVKQSYTIRDFSAVVAGDWDYMRFIQMRRLKSIDSRRRQEAAE